MVGLRLGTTDCVVLQSEESIRQALVTKADHFDSRPNFFRFHIMFGGSKKNGKWNTTLTSKSTCVTEDTKFIFLYVGPLSGGGGVGGNTP